MGNFHELMVLRRAMHNKDVKKNIKGKRMAIINRSKKNLCFWLAYKVASHKVFTIFISSIIIANTVILALDRYPVPD